MRRDVKVRLPVKTIRQIPAVKPVAQLPVRLRALDERTDEFQVALAPVKIEQIRRHFTRRGKRGGERDARQFAVLVKVIEQRREDFHQLSAKITSARGGLLHDLQPSVVRLADQRLKQA